MRLIPVLLLSVALATTAAGCFGKDDEPSADTNTTTPTGATPTGATPTGATPTSPTAGGNSSTPTKPAPTTVFSGSASFQQPPIPADPTNPTGGPPVQHNAATVPAGYTALVLNVTWAQSTPAGVSSGLKIQIYDPTGAPLGSGCSVAAGPVQGAPPACTETITIPNTGGAYDVAYSGSGTPTATVEVVAQ